MRLIYKIINPFTRYRYPYNINREQNIDYLNKVQRAKQLLDKNQQVTLIPRRKRRIYDRPRIDKDITDYGAWRLHDHEEWLPKFHDHSSQVLCRFNIAPKLLIHAFGLGSLPISHIRSAHREFMFQDNQLNCYLLYEYRNTTDYKPNKEGYDYENQEHLHPRERITKRVSPEYFWQSQDQFQFRINGTQYAQIHKFKEWLLSEIARRKDLKAYDDYIDEKFGKSLTFNIKQDIVRYQANKSMLMNVTPEHYNPKKGKIPQMPKNMTWSKLDEKYRIVRKEKSKQSLEKN